MLDVEQLLEDREEKDGFFKKHPHSPLDAAQREQFDGLSYYAPNEELSLKVTITQFEKKDNVQLQTNTGDTQWYRRFGEFTFTIDDKTARLTIYHSPNGFFLPVIDAGAGKETYPAGRYMEPVQLNGNEFLIDFNQLYNPYCAYNDGWTCPIAPAENRVAVSIKAGEMLPSDTWAK